MTQTKTINAFVATIFMLLAITGCNKELGVTGVNPASGVVSGGEPVTIKGSGFDPSMGFTIYFGSSKASNIMVSGTDSITVTTPGTSEEQVVDVRIVTDSGKTFTIKEGFRYIAKGSLDIRELGSRKSMRE